jgi:glycosyltransferase involved in cell wall biosynthesis
MVRVVHALRHCAADSVNGVERAVWHLGQAQRAAGAAVALVTSSDVAAETSPSGIARAASRLAFGRGERQDMLQRSLAFQPDIVHLHSIHVPENIWMAERLTRVCVPYCVTIHGGLSPIARHRGRLKKAAFTALWDERRYLNAAAFLHALTDEEARAIRAYGATAPVVTVPNGIDVSTLPRPRDRNALWALTPHLVGQRILLFVGRLDPFHKGLDLLLEAFALASPPRTALVLAGPDWKDNRARLAAMAERLAIAPRFGLINQLSPQQKADIMSAAHAFVHPSRWEGVSLAVLEAAAGETVCLLSRPADPSGVFEAAGACIAVNPTVPDIADGITRVLSMDAQALGAIARKARRTAELQFTWPSAAERLIAAYDRYARSMQTDGVQTRGA